MKLLMTTPGFPPMKDGVSNVAYAHATGLADRGHEITVVTKPNKEIDMRKMEQCGIKIVEFDVRGDGNVRNRYFGEIEKYQKFIATFKADAMLFSNWQTSFTNLAFRVFPLIDAKKILVSHGMSVNFVYNIKALFTHWIWWRPYIWNLPSMLKALDHIVFLSQRTDKDRFYDNYLCQKLGLKHYSVIPNGTYPSGTLTGKIDFKRKYNIKTKYMLLHLANYGILKNQKMSLRAFLESGVNDTTMVFIGSEKNDYASALKLVARKNNAEEKVLFLDKMSKEDIAAAYLAADVFICSSIWEAQPLVILDAMNAGLPFISSDVGCISELPGGVVCENQSDMACKIRELVENEKLRMHLGEEGRKACEQLYSWEVTVNKYELLLKNVVKGSK